MSTQTLVDALQQSVISRFDILHKDLEYTETILLNQIAAIKNSLNNNPDTDTGTGNNPPPIFSRTTDIDEDLLPLVNDGRIDIVNDRNYIVTHLFTTFNGNWDVNPNQPYAVKQRFRNKFLKQMNDPLYIDDGGAQKHILVGLYDHNWLPLAGYNVLFNTNDNNNPFTMATKRSGFANNQMSPDAAYWPSNGQSGNWYITLPNTALKVTGIGLINKWHVSTYVVIQKVN